MRCWLVLTVVGLLVSGIGPWSARADRAGKQSAAKASNHSPGFDKNAYEEGEGGILYGKGFAFIIRAPKGWVMDDQVGRSEGLLAVFYRRGESWAEGDATMYANVAYKIKGEDDTLDKVIRYDILQTKEHDPEMRAELEGPREVAGGLKAVVYTFSGPGKGRAQEKVAYVDTPQVVIMLVLTARSEAAYRTALPDYERLIRSFTFMTDRVKIEQAKPSPSKGGKKVH